MIELVLTVCLLAAPTECREERRPFEGGILFCAMAGQAVGVEWIATHPKWTLARWRCGPPSTDL